MSVHKSGSTWSVSFYYTEWNGERVRHRKKGFKTKRAAQEYEHDFLVNRSNTPKMSFDALIEAYMADCRNRLKLTTFTTKEAIVNRRILPHFSKVALDQITPVMVRKWQTTLISEGYSETYLKTVNNQFSAIMNYAVKYYGLSENPVAKCGAMGKNQADSIDFWTKEEFLRFEEVISDKIASKVIFDLLYWTGMRSGELLALTIDDFDFINNTVSISKTYTRLKCQDIITEPKTPKSRRKISVPASVLVYVKEYSEMLPFDESHIRLFPFTKSYLKHEMIRGSKAAGVKRIRIHDLRHSHASFLIELGCSPLLIAERLGHENIKTTLQTYSHLYPNKQAELAGQLDSIINDD